jgi:predicted negative regulator of RcsB-dependent stress response
MTTSATPSTPKADRVETFLDWFRVNSKLVAIGAAAVAAAAVVFWVVQRTNQNQESEAFRRLQVARQSVEQGNIPLATQDLTGLVQRYGDTRAGVQGSMLLAQLHYDRGEFQKGLDVLATAAGDADDESTRAAILAMQADGQVSLGKHDDAAQTYRRAADAARFDGQRALYLAARARALTAAGKTDEALTAWTELATNASYATVAGEAKVRLGELAAKPVAR